MEEKFKMLKSLGAGEFTHLNGTLIEHLEGTQNLLNSWGADPFLCDAGLFHAVYSTDGYADTLSSLTYRDKIAKVIGVEAERVVYDYCACDRDFVWPQIGHKDVVIFRDRFTKQERVLSSLELFYFCELTVANELEIAKHSSEFIQKHGEYLLDLFERMSPYISSGAIRTVKEVLGE